MLYDVNKNFAENASSAIHIPPDLPIIKRTYPSAWINFLDYRLASPIGLSACAIGLSKGIEHMARRGCDVLTYKTIRSKFVPAHQWPNILYVNYEEPITEKQIGAYITCKNYAQINNNLIAIANSFGNASFDVQTTFQDIIKAKKYLIDGQILIVSIYGDSFQEFIDAAHLAYSAGADALELNFSCPNLLNQVYYNNIIISETSKLKIPTVVKLGYYTDINKLRRMLKNIAHAGARAVCGINSIPMQVVDQRNNAAFMGRPIAGISGNPIRNLALNFIRNAREIITQEKLELALLATGGITESKHFYEFLNAGADIALSATGIMFNPNLPAEYHNAKNTPCP